MRPPSPPAQYFALARVTQAVNTRAVESRASQQEVSPKLCCTSLGPYQQRPMQQPPALSLQELLQAKCLLMCAPPSPLHPLLEQ